MEPPPCAKDGTSGEVRLLLFPFWLPDHRMQNKRLWYQGIPVHSAQNHVPDSADKGFASPLDTAEGHARLTLRILADVRDESTVPLHDRQALQIVRFKPTAAAGLAMSPEPSHRDRPPSWSAYSCPRLDHKLHLLADKPRVSVHPLQVLNKHAGPLSLSLSLLAHRFSHAPQTPCIPLYITPLIACSPSLPVP